MIRGGGVTFPSPSSSVREIQFSLKRRCELPRNSCSSLVRQETAILSFCAGAQRGRRIPRHEPVRRLLVVCRATEWP